MIQNRTRLLHHLHVVHNAEHNLQLVTDRFATPDGSSPSCDTGDRKYCGGTWKGIISKLDYIHDLGFDAVWISPVVANLEGNTTDGQAYHG